MFDYRCRWKHRFRSTRLFLSTQSALTDPERRARVLWMYSIACHSNRGGLCSRFWLVALQISPASASRAEIHLLCCEVNYASSQSPAWFGWRVSHWRNVLRFWTTLSVWLIILSASRVDCDNQYDFSLTCICTHIYIVCFWIQYQSELYRLLPTNEGRGDYRRQNLIRNWQKKALGCST